jgi:hypothetical protein
METYWVLDLLQESFDQSQPNSPGRAVRPTEPSQAPPLSSDWTVTVDLPPPPDDSAGPPPLGAWVRCDHHRTPPPGSPVSPPRSRRSVAGALPGMEWGPACGREGLAAATAPARWFAMLAPMLREPPMGLTSRRHSEQDHCSVRRRSEPRRRSSLAPLDLDPPRPAEVIAIQVI